MRRTITRAVGMLCLLMSIAWAVAWPARPANADVPPADWRVALRPASVNLRPDVKLIAGQEQILVAQLQARQALFKGQPIQRVEMVVHTPPGVKLLEVQSFIYKVQRFSPTQDDGSPGRFTLELRANGLVGEPGQPLNSDWRGLAMILQTPAHLPDDATLRIDLTWQGRTFTQAWPISVTPLGQDGRQPRRMRLGLWTYNWDRAGSRGGPIARFLQAVGVNHVQGDRFHQEALAAGISTGGAVHHGAFHDPDHPDLDALGNPHRGAFSDAQAIIDWSSSQGDLPGLRTLVETADRYAGRVTIDYEPNASRGFSARGIAEFKRRHGVSDAEFAIFHEAMRTHGRQTYLQAGPAEMAVYRQWVAFRSWQAERYIARYREALDRLRPGTCFEVTTVVSHTPDTLTTLGRGLVASQMAKPVDAILPQIYNGYDGVAAKLVGGHARGWRQAMDAQSSQAKLYPILMVRYAGAIEPLLNTPQRLRQQAWLCLAEGADGVAFYYPANMDAPYWQMLARLSGEMSRYESFYLDGQRLDDKLDTAGLPRRTATMRVWPGHEETVGDPDWHATAHRLEGRTLLTLFNLSERQPMVFGWRGEDGASAVSLQDAEQDGPGRWRVQPGHVAHVLLDQAKAMRQP